MDTKIYALINGMTRRQLGGVLLGAGFALPADKSRDALRDVVRSKFQDGTLDATDILAETSTA